MDLGLGGRVAVVTGASRGIGRSVAAELAAEDCRLVLCARGADELEVLAGELAGRGGQVAALPLDVTEAGAPERVVAAALGRFGRLDILVNNAGGGPARRLAELTDDDWRGGFELNFFAAARLATACAAPMRRQRWGRIVNVASTYGLEPDPWFGPYAAAKAALINLSKSLSRAWSADGVLTNCVVPGITRTELVEANAAAAAAAGGTRVEEVMARMMAKDPVAAGRFGEPGEVAAAVVFLASARASWISGACLAVDGGTLRSAT